ncbi:MAG: hypothetical protein JXB35_10360 [Anaerolineae bacterium]|nr:hypothetical protein [Anaerolineae bacterium]
MKKRLWGGVLCGMLLSGLAIGCTSKAVIEEPGAPTATSLPTSTPTPLVLILTTATPAPGPSTQGATPGAPPAPLTPAPISAPAPFKLGETYEGGALGKIWNLAELRYAFHADRLRLVWEMAEPGATVPKYQVTEVDNATSPFPSGYDPAWGSARIDLVLSDVYARDGQLPALPIGLAANPAATQIGIYPTYDDARLGFSIGLHRAVPFTVYQLTDPVRIVIDIVYP